MVSKWSPEGCQIGSGGARELSKRVFKKSMKIGSEMEAKSEPNGSPDWSQKSLKNGLRTGVAPEGGSGEAWGAFWDHSGSYFGGFWEVFGDVPLFHAMVSMGSIQRLERRAGLGLSSKL